jgi:hypothetical protein
MKNTKKEIYMLEFINDIFINFDKINTNDLISSFIFNNYTYFIRIVNFKFDNNENMTEINIKRKEILNETKKIKPDYDYICFYKYEEASISKKEKFAYRRENTKYYGKPIDYELYLNGYIFETYNHYHKRK